jgi:hypothetical protein
VHGALTLYTDKTVAGMSTIMENFVFFSDAFPAMLLQYTIPAGLCQIWLAVPMAFEGKATDTGKGISATATRDPLKIPVYILYLWAFFFLLVSHQLLHYIN